MSHVHTPVTRNQEFLHSAKPIPDIAPHITDLREQHSTWTLAYRNSAQPLRIGEISPDQDAIFQLSTPQSATGLLTILNMYRNGSPVEFPQSPLR